MSSFTLTRGDKSQYWDRKRVYIRGDRCMYLERKKVNIFVYTYVCIYICTCIYTCILQAESMDICMLYITEKRPIV